MKKETILEVLDAAHLTRYVNGPFRERGGIMLVAPPAALKTSFLKNSFDPHPDALIMSDLNYETLNNLKSDLQNGRYATFAFTEYEKLYQRHSSTAMNLEGCIKALVAEGWTLAGHQDQRLPSMASRCLIVGAMTPDFHSRKFKDWDSNGFLRRFLWCFFTVGNAYVLTDAIARWELLDLGEVTHKSPGNRNIPYNVTDHENHDIQIMLKEQVGQHIPLIMLKKILCVLKWKYKEDDKKPMKIMRDFAECLRKSGAEMIL